MPFSTTQTELECIMFSEISQTEKDEHYNFMWNLKNKTNVYNKTERGRKVRQDRNRGLRSAKYDV